ncbi:sister chromatid cohesion protein Ctf8 [Tirmania nivea]|nr:sister chromatid cohesion protein Ctf8 [Tirmania nivea]
MPTVPLHPPTHPTTTLPDNPLPPFLHTPHGIFLLELQGTLQIEQLSSTSQPDPSSIPEGYHTQRLPIGLLAFPPDAFKMMPKTAAQGGKRGKNGAVKEVGGVLLFVGRWQKMRGEVRELGRPLGVLRRREVEGDRMVGGGEGDGGNGGVQAEGVQGEEVEIVDVVRWKVVFSTRPEPVG